MPHDKQLNIGDEIPVVGGSLHGTQKWQGGKAIVNSVIEEDGSTKREVYRILTLPDGGAFALLQEYHERKRTDKCPICGRDFEEEEEGE